MTDAIRPSPSPFAEGLVDFLFPHFQLWAEAGMRWARGFGAPSRDMTEVDLRSVLEGMAEAAAGRAGHWSPAEAAGVLDALAVLGPGLRCAVARTVGRIGLAFEGWATPATTPAPAPIPSPPAATPGPVVARARPLDVFWVGPDFEIGLGAALAAPGVVLRFEGQPDLVLTDAEGAALAQALRTGTGAPVRALGGGGGGGPGAGGGSAFEADGRGARARERIRANAEKGAAAQRELAADVAALRDGKVLRRP